MSPDNLPDLLHDRVSDVTMPDVSVVAWRDGVRRRRRRAALSCGVAVAAVVVPVVVLSGLLGGPTGTTGDPAGTGGPSPNAPTTQEPSEGASSAPDTTYRGYPAWVAPPAAREAGMPLLEGTGLTPEIDLSPAAPSAQGIGPAVAVLAAWPDDGLDRVVAVGTDGESRALEVEGRVARTTDEGGNEISPLTHDSLAPDGRRAFFVQERSLEVVDLETGRWTSLATPRWLAEGARWVTGTEIWVPDRLGQSGGGTSYDVVSGTATPARLRWSPVWETDDQPFGALRTTADGAAQSHFLARSVEVRGSSVAGVDAVVATNDGRTRLLLFPLSEDRWKACCPVVGWASADTVLLESRSAQARVLAWRVGTHDLRVVSRIVGWTPGEESYVASWALPDV